MARLSNFTHLFSSIQAKSVFNTPPSVFSSPSRVLTSRRDLWQNFSLTKSTSTNSSNRRLRVVAVIERCLLSSLKRTGWARFNRKESSSRTYYFPRDKYGKKLESHSCIIQIQKCRSSPAFVRSTARGATLLHRRCPLPHTATYLLASLLHCSQCYQPRHHH